MNDVTRYRIYELIPGTLIWTTFIFALVFSFVYPIGVIVFIIIFDLFWVFRVLYFIFYLILSFFRYRRAIGISWMKKVKELPDWQEY